MLAFEDEVGVRAGVVVTSLQVRSFVAHPSLSFLLSYLRTN